MAAWPSCHSTPILALDRSLLYVFSGVQVRATEPTVVMADDSIRCVSVRLPLGRHTLLQRGKITADLTFPQEERVVPPSRSRPVHVSIRHISVGRQTGRKDHGPDGVLRKFPLVARHGPLGGRPSAKSDRGNPETPDAMHARHYL